MTALVFGSSAFSASYSKILESRTPSPSSHNPYKVDVGDLVLPDCAERTRSHFASTLGSAPSFVSIPLTEVSESEGGECGS